MFQEESPRGNASEACWEALPGVAIEDGTWDPRKGLDAKALQVTVWSPGVMSVRIPTSGYLNVMLSCSFGSLLSAHAIPGRQL